MQIRPRLRTAGVSGAGVTFEEVEEVWAYCTARQLAKSTSRASSSSRSGSRGKNDRRPIAILIEPAGMELVVQRRTS